MNTEKVISRDGDYILHTYGRSQVVQLVLWVL